MSTQHVQQPTGSFAQPGERMECSSADPRRGSRSSDEGQSRFEIYRTERVNLTSTLFGGGDWHWRLIATSGAVLADCGGYRNEAECLDAVEALRGADTVPTRSDQCEQELMKGGLATSDDKIELMARFGITKVPAHRYHYRHWRYSSLGDALAQARRDTASSTVGEHT